MLLWYSHALQTFPGPLLHALHLLASRAASRQALNRHQAHRVPQAKPKPADRPSSSLPQAFAAVFGTSKAAADAPLAGASPCARHSTPFGQAASPDNGTQVSDGAQNLAAAAFGRKTTTGGAGLFGATGMKLSGNDFSAAVKAKGAGGPFVFNLTAAAGHEPAESVQTASDRAAPRAGTAADGVTDPLAAGGLASATGPAPAAASTRPPAGSNNPSAASQTPPAASSAPAAASSNLQPTQGAAAEQGAPASGAAGFAHPRHFGAAAEAAAQRGSAFTFGSQAPTTHSAESSLLGAESSLFGAPLSTSQGSAPELGRFPSSNPLLAPPSTPNLFGFPNASTGQAAKPFAFSQQRPMSAGASQQVPQPFSFGHRVSSAAEPGTLFG